MDFLNKTYVKTFDATPVEVTNSSSNTSNPKENYCESIDLENNSPVKVSDKQRISLTKEASHSEAMQLVSEGVVRLDDEENGERIGRNDEKFVRRISDPEEIVLLDEGPDCEIITNNNETQDKFNDKKEKSSDVSPDQQRDNSAEKSIDIEVKSPDNDGSFPAVVSFDMSGDSQLPKLTSEVENVIALDEEEGGKKKLPERVRRVAKKSTRPPIHPQTQPSEEELEKEEEKIENPRKRSANSPLRSPPRKTARKSTRPPMAPQVLSFMFVDESKEEEETTEIQEICDNDEVTEITTDKTQEVAEDREKEWEKIREQAWDISDDVSKDDNAVLLDSPVKGSDKLDEDSDIEEITIS